MKREKARFVVWFSASPLMATGDAYFRTEDGGWCSMWNTNESGNRFDDELSSEEMFDTKNATGWDSFVLVLTKKQHKKIQKMIDRQKAR